MLMVQDNKNFDAMADSEFSFEPITRVWFGIAPKVPKKIREDLVAVKKYLLDFNNKLIARKMKIAPVYLYIDRKGNRALIRVRKKVYFKN